MIWYCVLFFIGLGFVLLLHTIAPSIPMELKLFIAISIMCVGWLTLPCFVVLSLIEKPACGFVFLLVDNEQYGGMLPPQICYVHCRLTNWAEPYKMSLMFSQGVDFHCVQSTSNSKEFKVLNANGAEVVRASGSSVLNSSSNECVLTSAGVGDPVVILDWSGKDRQLSLRIKDEVSLVKYTRAPVSIDSMGAELHFGWNKIDVWFDREVSPLSDSMHAAVIFSIFLYRSQAGGW